MRRKTKIHRQHEAKSSENYQKLDFFRSEMWNISIQNAFPIYPFCMEEAERSSKVWFHENYCRFMIIVIMLEGDIIYRFDGKEQVVSRGQIVVIPQNESYFFENGPSGHYRKAVLEFMGANLMSNMETLGLNKICILNAGNFLKLVDDARSIGDILHKQQQEDIPLLLGKSIQFLTEISMLLPKDDDCSTMLAKAQMRLESRLERKLTLIEVADELGVATVTINRIFNEKLGITPIQYRIEKKIEKANFLLANTSLSIKEIAYQLGYCNQFYFSLEFRKITGKRPSEARRERRINK